MTTIAPVNRESAHNFFLKPYFEGIKRINEAWQGATSEDYSPIPLSWKTRTVYLITGSLLLVPLINTVIWLFWKTFGHPTSPPPVPETPIAATAPKAAKTEAVKKDVAPTKAPDFIYNETLGNKKTTINVHILPQADGSLRLQKSDDDYCIYNADLTLSEFHSSDSGLRLDIMREGDTLKATLTPERKSPIVKSLKIPKDIPWIQEPLIGFRTFLLSDKKECSFFSVMDENPTDLLGWGEKPPLLMVLDAYKTEESDKTLNLEIVSTWSTIKCFGEKTKGRLSFSPATAANPPILKKYSAPKKIDLKREGVLVPNSR